MIHHPPNLDYQGLTIILSQPSRFDGSQLLSGNAGNWFNNECLRPGMNRWQCDIYDVDSFNKINRQYREGTKCVLLLGNRAHKEIGRQETSLSEHRGSPFYQYGIVHISSFSAQDTHDVKDFEKYLNPMLAEDYAEDYEEEADDKDTNAASEKSRHGRTARSNYRFWLQRDTRKAVRICKENGVLRIPTQPTYVIYPSVAEVVAELERYENDDFFIDIETDSQLNITCFGFTFGKNRPIFVVPVLRYTYSLAYDFMGQVFRALCKAMRRNNTIAHNGAGFDFIVFPFRYRLPFGRRLSDTLVMHHRCFPELEKSLGHGISNFTDLPYHKDEGVFEPTNEMDERSLWSYNGKDVYGMRELYYAMLSYADTVAGLRSSIDQANDSIYPYVLEILTGMRYRADKMQATIAENDRRMMHLLRMLEAAVGADLLKVIRGKGKSSMPGSQKQCVTYFHDICGYPIVGYGKPSEKDGKRKPSLNEKNFWKLVLKLHENNIHNPVIDIVLHYRKLAKETSMLKFNPWPGLRNPLVTTNNAQHEGIQQFTHV